jgi:hypothetical protein
MSTVAAGPLPAIELLPESGCPTRSQREALYNAGIEQVLKRDTFFDPTP